MPDQLQLSKQYGTSLLLKSLQSNIVKNIVYSVFKTAEKTKLNET